MNSPVRKSTQTKALRGIKPPSIITTDADRRRSTITQAAYYISERRGFAPGHELDDWLTAESEIDAALARD